MPSLREEVYCQGISSVGPGTPKGGSTSECVDDHVGLENLAVFMGGQRLVGTRRADERRWQRGDGEDGGQNVVVGFAFMAKKMDSMSKVALIKRLRLVFRSRVMVSSLDCGFVLENRCGW